MRNRRTD